jgi:hydroxyacylglutathione hydrolase
MLIERIRSEGLAHSSYFVADGGEAVVVDPRRDVDAYLDLARDRQVRIRYVLETHRNEDYLVGSTALAQACGAEVLHSHRLPFGYGTPVREGDLVGIGRLELRVLETPGHTPESLTFSLADRRAGREPFMAFTGDTLLVGEVGRTDLFGEEMAARLVSALFESLYGKILPLGDGVVLAPAHGGGSVCGADISDREESSIGFEKAHSPKLRANSREAFLRAQLSERLPIPPYFERMEQLNLRGTMPVFERLPLPPPLEPAELVEQLRDGAALIDTRTPQAFAGGHIPGSLSLWEAGLPGHLGWLVSPDSPIVLLLEDGESPERATRMLLRIGFDQLRGFLRGGFTAWAGEGREIARAGSIEARELRDRLESGEPLTIVDVRERSEHAHGIIPGARPIFLGELEARLDELPRGGPIVSMCSIGNRGSIGASLLLRHGFSDVSNLAGGFAAWKAIGGPVAFPEPGELAPAMRPSEGAEAPH